MGRKFGPYLALCRLSKSRFSIAGRKSFNRLITAAVLCFAVLTITLVHALAASSGANIDMSDTNPPASGTGWTYNSTTSIYTILDGANVTVTGYNGSTQRGLAIAANAAATVTLNGASIDVSAQSGQSPLLLNSGANLTLTLIGTNSLMAGQAAAGIQVPSGTTLTISSAGTGTLTSLGGTSVAIYGPGGGAGIGTGGGAASTTGTINIAGGTITATGSDNGAGIGGGADSSVGTITISGGNITATGGSWGGAGIGGGSAYNGGSGTNGAGGTISITGGTVTANGGNTSSNSGAGGGAGIGGAGANNAAWGATSTSGASGNITISAGANVTATGGNGGGDGGGAGIGSGGQGGTGAVGQAGMTASTNTINVNPLTTSVNAQGGTSTNAPSSTWNGASAGFGGGSNPPLTTTSSQMLPGAPTNLQTALQTNGDVILTWNPPTPLTGITLSYIILVDGSQIASGVTAFTYTVPGGSLSDGSHTFAVRAATQYSAIGPQVSATLSDVVFTSASNTSVINGTGRTFQVTTTGSPFGFTLAGAPAGVAIDSNGLITIPGSVAEGTYTFSITANDAFLSATQNFSLTVTPAPVAPAVTSSNNKSVVNGTGGTFQVTATGTTPITYSISGAPTGVSLDGSSGIMTIAGNVPVGTYPFTITVSNDVGSANQAFTLTVTEAPAAPEITSVDNTHVVSGTGGTFQVTATGTLPFTYSVTGAPPDVSIDSTNGTMTIAGTIPADTYTFTVTVSNAIPPDATQNFTLTVTDAPVAPDITSASNTSVINGTGGSFQVTATGTTPITYSISDAPADVSINSANGLITIDAAVPPGTYTFTVTANNSAGTANQTFNLTVTPAPVAPAITSSNNKSVVSGTGGTFQVTSTGTMPIAYSISGAPTGVSIDFSSGVMTIDAAVPAGAYPLTITVSNSVGSANQAFTLTVTEAPVAPDITSVDNTHVVSGTGGTFKVTSTGTLPFTYSITGAPADVSIDSTNGTMTIAGTISAGTYTYTVTVTNGIQPDATQTFTLTVTEAPIAPVITSAGNTSVINGTGGSFQVTATGSAPIVYSATGAPAGVSINSANGLMTIDATTPSGTYTYTITVSNGVSPDATQTFNLTVTLAPVAPAVTSSNNKSVVNGTGGSFQVAATGTTPITYSISGAPTGVSIDSSSGIITIAGTVPVGTYPFTITANNTAGTANQTFTLTVTEAPVAPTITSANNANVVSGTGGTFQVTSTGTLPFTYSITGAPPDVSINSTNGTMTIAGSIPAGTYTYTVTVSNGILPNAAQTFTLTVTEAPAITSVDNTHVVSGTGGTFQVTATGTAPLTYSISGAPTGVSIDSSSGIITIAETVTADTYTYTITARNGILPNAVQSFTLTVTEATVAPDITSAGNTSVINGTGGTFQMTTTGTMPITYSISGAPTGVNIDSANGLITIDAAVPPGTYTFTETANNSAGTANQTFNLTVTPAPVAPAITSSNNKRVVSGTGGTFRVTSTGTMPIAYSVSGAPTGVNIDIPSGVMTIDAAVPVGTYPLTITVSNNVSSANQAFTLTVTEAPVAPDITSVDNTHVVSGTGGTFKVTSTGTLPFTYSITGAPANVSIDSTNGTMTVAGTILAGTYTFTVTVTNGIQPDATQTFTLTVTEAPVAPVITSVNHTYAVSGTGGSYQLTASGSAAIVYSITGAPTGVSINSANGLMTIDATASAGTYKFNIAADNSAGTASQVFTLIVTPAPATPVPPPPPTQAPTPTPSPTPTPTPSPQPHTPGGTDPHTPPQTTVPGHRLISDGANWIEQDTNGNQHGRWTWSAQDGMWIFEEFPTPASQFFANLLSTPLGIASLVVVALLITGLIIWLCMSHRTKRRR
ncbi:MAG: putative Ig domain-containing protein [Oscillospiraceae bacterium]|nr:putative Ig domain-containing protein [Oscillospiraceae bacterium]